MPQLSADAAGPCAKRQKRRDLARESSLDEEALRSIKRSLIIALAYNPDPSPATLPVVANATGTTRG